MEIEFDFRQIPETDTDKLVEPFQELDREISEGQVEVILLNPPMATEGEYPYPE